MSATPEGSLTLLDRVLWVVDNTRVKPRACVAADGTVTPNPDETIHLASGTPGTPAEEGVPLVDLLEELARPDKRGAKRQGLTARTWLALFIAAGAEGHHKITSTHRFATGTLPREKQWELGILTRDARTGKVREMTVKQLYTFTENINRSLDTDPGFELDEPELKRRNTILDGITDALIAATHAVPRVNSSIAVDESGVWCWTKDTRKPQNLSLADPRDLDVVTKADIKISNPQPVPMTRPSAWTNPGPMMHPRTTTASHPVKPQQMATNPPGHTPMVTQMNTMRPKAPAAPRYAKARRSAGRGCAGSHDGA